MDTGKHRHTAMLILHAYAAKPERTRRRFNPRRDVRCGSAHCTPQTVKVQGWSCKRTISEAVSECVFHCFHYDRCAGAAKGLIGDIVLLAVIVYNLLKLFALTEVSCVAYIGRGSSDPVTFR
jgi:hypothetical protein